MFLGVLNMYKLIVLLESLYRVHIVKLNLYLFKYWMILEILNMHKLTVFLEFL